MCYQFIGNILRLFGNRHHSNKIFEITIDKSMQPVLYWLKNSSCHTKSYKFLYRFVMEYLDIFIYLYWWKVKSLFIHKLFTIARIRGLNTCGFFLQIGLLSIVLNCRNLHYSRCTFLSQQNLFHNSGHCVLKYDH